MPNIDFLSVVPAEKRQKAQDCLTARKDYEPFLPDADGELTIPNPESAYDFSNRMIYEWLYREYEAKRVEDAVKTARADAIAAAKTEF